MRAMGWCGTELLAAGLGDGTPLFLLLILFLLLVLLPGTWRPLELRRGPGRVGYLPALGPSRGISARRSRRSGALPPPYPNGWYRVLDSEQLPRGAVRSLALLGECGIPAETRGRRGPGCRVGAERPRRIPGALQHGNPRPGVGRAPTRSPAGYPGHPFPGHLPWNSPIAPVPLPGHPRRDMGDLRWELHWGIRTFLPRHRAIPARVSRVLGHPHYGTGHPAPMPDLCLGSLSVRRTSLPEHPCWGTPKPCMRSAATLGHLCMSLSWGIPANMGMWARGVAQPKFLYRHQVSQLGHWRRYGSL